MNVFPLYSSVEKNKFHCRVIPCQITPPQKKIETAPPQILIKLHTLPLCDYNRRPVIFFSFFEN